MEKRLLDGGRIGRVLAKPCEPHGCMVFDPQSIHDTDQRQSDQPTPRRPQTARKGVDDVQRSRDPQPQGEDVVPAYGQKPLFGHRLSPFVSG